MTKLMTVDELFSDDGDWSRMHDIMAEISGRTYTDAQCRALFDTLPARLQGEALIWGIETVVGDAIYVHLCEIGWAG